MVPRHGNRNRNHFRSGLFPAADGLAL